MNDTTLSGFQGFVDKSVYTFRSIFYLLKVNNIKSILDFKFETKIIRFKFILKPSETFYEKVNDVPDLTADVRFLELMKKHSLKLKINFFFLFLKRP